VNRIPHIPVVLLLLAAQLAVAAFGVAQYLVIYMDSLCRPQLAWAGPIIAFQVGVVFVLLHLRRGTQWGIGRVTLGVALLIAVLSVASVGSSLVAWMGPFGNSLAACAD
jgi:hypothetical protein